jgi:hypothetical protein
MSCLPYCLLILLKEIMSGRGNTIPSGEISKRQWRRWPWQ